MTNPVVPPAPRVSLKIWIAPNGTKRLVNTQATPALDGIVTGVSSGFPRRLVRSRALQLTATWCQRPPRSRGSRSLTRYLPGSAVNGPGTASTAVPGSVVVADARRMSPPPSGSTRKGNVPTPPNVTLERNSCPGGGCSASVNKQFTVSPAASRIDTDAVARLTVAVLEPCVHVRPVRSQPDGTSSRTFHGASPGPVSARKNVCDGTLPFLTLSENRWSGV